MKVINTDFYNYNENWVNAYISPGIKDVPAKLAAEEVEKMGIGTNIYFANIFNERFCDTMVQIAENIEERRWHTDRHPSYPTTDIELHEVGLDNLYAQVLRDFMFPLAIETYQLEGSKPEDYFAENFLIKYTPDKQNHLTIHNDSSMFTFNVSLNNDFQGGGIFFEKHNLTLQPMPGGAVLNPGMIGYKHGAKPIVSGKRYMLISFVLEKQPYQRQW